MCSAAGRKDVDQQSHTRPFVDRNSRYRIHPGDVLDIVFPLASDFNQTIAVQPDGYLGLRGAGEIKISDMTLPEVSTAVRAAYSQVMLNPTFTLTLKDFAKPLYTVAGEVKNPGGRELRGEVTVMQAVMGAGGFTVDAKNSQVLLFRHLPDNWYEVKQMNVKHMLKSKNLSEDVFVQAGDIIFVPKSFIGKISRFMPSSSVGSYIPLAIP
jgi:protein involved in polysaccharide export with SLBB domain